ncbi:MAG: hypothetical protein ABL985_15715 [Casimicrobium sp.]
MAHFFCITSGRTLYRFVVIAATAVAAVLFSFNAQALPGDYDLTYSGDGKASILMGTFAGSRVSTTRSVLTADQKLIIAGECTTGGNTTFCLTRFNTDGSQDLTFGTSGLAAGPSAQLNLTNVTGLAIDPRNQALVVGGECKPAGAGNKTFCLARFTQNGVFNMSYGAPGGFGTAFSFGDVKNGRLRVAADGKIRMGSGCPRGPAAANMDMCILALNADGTPDLAFTGTTSHYLLVPQIATDRAESVADLEYLADGRLFYVGPCKNTPNVTAYFYVCYGSVNPDGTQAAGRGKFFISDYDDYPTQVLRSGDGALLIAGYSEDSSNFTDAEIFARVNYSATSGTSFDATFNPGGASSGRLVGTYVTSIHPGSLTFALSGNQEIYQTIVTHGPSGGAGPFVPRVIARHSDGSIRATWGGTANALYDTSYENILLDDAGKVLLSGRSNYLSTSGIINFGRLQNDSSAGFACSMDIDGDGKVLATTDGVLLSRAMLGIKGTALTLNATGAGASRTNPDAIRAYLLNRCKMPLN